MASCPRVSFPLEDYKVAKSFAVSIALVNLLHIFIDLIAILEKKDSRKMCERKIRRILGGIKVCREYRYKYKVCV